MGKSTHPHIICMKGHFVGDKFVQEDGTFVYLTKVQPENLGTGFALMMKDWRTGGYLLLRYLRIN